MVRRRVLRGARVRRHGHAVVVLHPCGLHRPPFAGKSRRRRATIPKRTPRSNRWRYPLLRPDEFVLYPQNSQVEYLSRFAMNKNTDPVLCVPPFLLFLCFFCCFVLGLCGPFFPHRLKLKAVLRIVLHLLLRERLVQPSQRERTPIYPLWGLF